MIIKRYIEADLKSLDVLYTNSISGPDSRLPTFYSKLGVLELAGWLEDSFDKIARRSVKWSISSPKFNKLLESAIKQNHGFAYDENFISMMSKIVGLFRCEVLEAELDRHGGLAVLTSEINSITTQRRVAAHVARVHTTVGFDAPSVSLARLHKIYPIVREIYSSFCK